ncbi:MAG: SDR family NAD(P)-dependent oxidoreductase [Dehalococcoidia bacterium]|nr:SDR family NAD(P)-dependent oxidoreductase [Dehalococcoidia bacterium]
MSVFNGKVAIVTGAGSGIGKGLAGELARRGANVVISDINAGRIEQVAQGIARDGGKVTSSVVDVSNYDAVKNMVNDAVDAHARIDYIFNNAGIAVAGPAKDFTIDDWRNVIDIDFYGVVHGVAVAYPIMVKQGFGHIINTASIAGLAPLPGIASYVAGKYGVVGLSNALRIEGAGHGVKVSVVCPGYIKTAIFTDSKIINIDVGKRAQMPDWGGLTPDECAKRILRGVERNKAFIILTGFAQYLSLLNRISPDLVIWIMRRGYGNALKKGMIQM